MHMDDIHRSSRVFAYWTGEGRSKIADMIDAWSFEFESFVVFEDQDVLPLLLKYSPNHVELFNAIQIPAAKADIARLLLLYEHGGLYVDCHCGIRNASEIRHLLGLLGSVELIFIDRILAYQPRPPETHFLLNTIMFVAPRSPLLLEACHVALSHLSKHWNEERKRGYIPYNIGSLTGPNMLNSVVFRADDVRLKIRPDYAKRILIIPEESAPFVRGKFDGYRSAGIHWSERQKTEPLFNTNQP